MNQKFLSGCCFFIATLCFAQSNLEKQVDSLYKEDQFYVGVTYNLIGNRPQSISQRGFSSGFLFGLIKDIPLNKQRNIGIGIGLGYAVNSFNHNLLVDKDENQVFTYEILNQNNSFTKNKFSNHLIEVPFEFRWRTSTATNYNFWRIYTGFKLSYVLSNSMRYEGDLGIIKHTNNPDFHNFQYGFTLSAGYNTWNLYIYYPMNSIFSKQAQLNDSPLNMSAIKLGLLFYIL